MIPGKGRDFPFIHPVQTGSGPLSASCLVDRRVSFPWMGVKGARAYAAAHSPPSAAVVRMC